MSTLHTREMLGSTSAALLKEAINAVPLLSFDVFYAVVAQFKPAAYITPEAYYLLYDATQAFGKQIIIAAARYKQIYVQNHSFKVDGVNYYQQECYRFQAVSDKQWARFKVQPAQIYDMRARRVKFDSAQYYNINFRTDDAPIRIASTIARMPQFYINIIQQILQRKQAPYDKTLFNTRTSPITNVWLHLLTQQPYSKQICDFYEVMSLSGRNIFCDRPLQFPSRDSGSLELSGSLCDAVIKRLKAVIGRLDVVVICE